MIDEVIAQVLAFWNDGTTGINAMIPSLPLDVGDAAPRVVRIIADVDDNRVARADVDPSLVKDGPVFLVMQGAPVEQSLFGEQSKPAPGVTLGLKWAARVSDTRAGFKEGRKIMRIAQRSIAVQFDSPNVGRSPARNQVVIDPPGPWHSLLPWNELKDSNAIVVVGATIVFPAFDRWALGITN